MTALTYDDDYLSAILGGVGTIALVGASANTGRPSHMVMEYLLDRGYAVHPVNPGQAGGEILGQTVYATLADVPGPVDMVDVFRNATAAGHVIDEAIRLKTAKGIRVVWLQLGVRNDDAAKRAQAMGLRVVMDRCPKIEFARLFGGRPLDGFSGAGRRPMP